MKKHSGQIIIAPRVTEKAALLQEQGAYAFDVALDATKAGVAAAIREVYKVSPRKVTLVRTPRKRVVSRNSNRAGYTAATKKAYVFLKQGDKIEIA